MPCLNLITKSLDTTFYRYMTSRMMTQASEHSTRNLMLMVTLLERNVMNGLHLPEFNAYLRFHDIAGPGIPLVFIHGFGCASSCDYPRVVTDPALSPRRFLLVDLFGSGFSDHPEAFSFSMDAHARCLIALLDALEISRIDLYGHSMGGAIAILVAAQQPERIRRFIASEPALDTMAGPSILAVAAQSETDYVAHGHSAAIQAAIESGNPIWAGSLAASSPIAIHREAKSRLLGGTPSWREQLVSLPIPRTILFGERSLPHSDYLNLPGAGISVDVVPDAGHSMMWENPSGLAGAIQRALT